jgi:hypothetical protein
MGDPAGKLVDTMPQPDVGDVTPEDADEAWFGFRFTIESDQYLGNKELDAINTSAAGVAVGVVTELA